MLAGYTIFMLTLVSPPRFLLFSMVPHSKDRQLVESEQAETAALIETYGGELVEATTQNESHFNQATYIGKGKIQDLALVVRDKQIDVLVVNATLTPSQLFALQSQLQAATTHAFELWDRTDLILNIFKRHARTAEANLQIRLAETRHKGPGLQGIGQQMSQQGGGIGAKGFGETQSEIMRRHWKKEIREIEEELDKLTTNRLRQMEHRKNLRLPTISIVGYTNAGKSTLFNLLTKKENLVQDAPFATLDSSVGKLYLHTLRKESFLTDTIGFIQNLAPALVQAFRSTLAETVNADLLLHVIDVTDEFLPEKIATVEEVLTSLGVQEKPQMYVFNKMDSLTESEREEAVHELRLEYPDKAPQFVSAVSAEGIPELIAAIEERVKLT